MFDLIPFGRNERNLFNYLDNVERSFWDGSISNMAQFRCDVQDKGDSYLLEAELPGFEREDIGIDLDGTTPVSYTHLDVYKRQHGAQRPGRRIRLRAHAGGAVCPAGTLRLFSLPPLLPCEHAEGTGGGALDAQQLRAAAGERAGIRCAAQQGPH